MANGDTEPNSFPATVLRAELDVIRTRRKTYDLSDSWLANRLTGLALSGGGIRSATFALGVLQRLAKEDLLKRFDYLSTVSGGGYIGGSLTWLLNQTDRPQAIGAAFPYGLDKHRLGQDESDVLKHLRLHGKYMTPGRGITATSLAAVILRGIVLNFLVWLPLAVLVFCSLQSVAERSGKALGGGLKILAERSGTQASAWLNELAECLGGEVGGYLSALAVVGTAFLVASVTYSLCTWRPTLPQPYRWRRRFERHVRWLLWAGLALVGLGSLPFVNVWLVAVSLLAGLAGGYKSFSGSSELPGGKIPIGLVVPVAAFLILYGMALAAYNLAGWYLEVASQFPGWWLPTALAASVVTGWIVNLNYVSIHRYYRDRLMEAFMPYRNTDGKTKAACAADQAKLSEMCIKNGPYHLVNTNVVLIGTGDRRWRVRGGDSFVLSPLYCGGTATGWEKTADYMKRDPLTLPTAVAISGAALNPNTGSGGVGLTRQRGLSLLMALLNVRLGYWVPHPKAKGRQRVANHFRAAWHELSPRGYSEERKLLLLSDGGHFENLGVYELVRRRVKVILCCDASADPGFDFAALQVLMRRIGTDFGAQIEFDSKKGNQIERIIPRDPDHIAYPVGTRFAKCGHVQATIRYRDRQSSTLILLKTTMIDDLDLLLRGYKGANRDFPDQSTADQFFDEEQFEAYRELGYEIADRMIEDEQVNLKRLLGQCTQPQDDRFRLAVPGCRK